MAILRSTVENELSGKDCESLVGQGDGLFPGDGLG